MSEQKALYQAGQPTVEWTNFTVPLCAITPWEHNPKSISKAHAKRLLAYWEKIGQFQTLAIGPDGELYDGNQRYAVLLAAHGDQYPVDVRRASRALAEDERRELVIQAHAGTVGQWDWDGIAGWDAAQVQGWGMDGELLKEWKSDASALTMMIEASKPHADAEPQIDRASELQEKWQTVTGQLWRIGDHRLLVGDSTIRDNVDKLMGDCKALLFATDPPYGANAGNIGFTAQRDDIEAITKDDLEGKEMQAFLELAFKAWIPSLADNAAWYLWHPMLTQGYFAAAAAAAAADLIIHRQIIWVKEQFIFGRGDYHWRHELCFYGWRKGNRPEWLADRNQDTVWFIDWGIKRAEIGHPTAKPPELFAKPMINHTRKGAICAEPFAGSGSQFVAGQNEERRVYGMELETKYCALILERMATAFPGIEIERL